MDLDLTCENIPSTSLSETDNTIDFLNDSHVVRGQSNGLEFRIIQSNKGKKTLFRNGYMYRQDHLGKDHRISWRCSTRSCHAQIKTDDMVETILQDNSKPHSHDAVSARLDRQLLRTACKRRAVTDIRMRLSDIIKEEMRRFNLPYMSSKDTKFLQLAMYRQRKKAFPDKATRNFLTGFREKEVSLKLRLPVASEAKDDAPDTSPPEQKMSTTSEQQNPEGPPLFQQPFVDFLEMEAENSVTGNENISRHHQPFSAHRRIPPCLPHLTNVQDHIAQALQQLPAQEPPKSELSNNFLLAQEPQKSEVYISIPLSEQPPIKSDAQIGFSQPHQPKKFDILGIITQQPGNPDAHSSSSPQSQLPQESKVLNRLPQSEQHHKLDVLKSFSQPQQAQHSDLLSRFPHSQYSKQSLPIVVHLDSVTATTSKEKPKDKELRITKKNNFCYSELQVHKELINDKVHFLAYRRALHENRTLIDGSYVLDVGAGSGILSHFAVQAGAQKVYAVEASDLAVCAEKIVKENLASSYISVIHKTIEDVELPKKVDILVSDWMGSSLFSKSSLAQVITARDKFLRKDGEMFPCLASLFLAPITDREYLECLKGWRETKNVYGVSMESLVPLTKDSLTVRTNKRHLDVESVLASAVLVGRYNLRTVTKDQLNHISSTFSFRCFGQKTMHGFATWFTVTFPGSVCLDTSPFALRTHWGQTVLYLRSPLSVTQDTELSGTFLMQPCEKNDGRWNIGIEYKVSGGKKHHQHWKFTD